MADKKSSASLQPSYKIEDLFAALDPMSLIRSRNSSISLQSKQEENKAQVLNSQTRAAVAADADMGSTVLEVLHPPAYTIEDLFAVFDPKHSMLSQSSSLIPLQQKQEENRGRVMTNGQQQTRAAVPDPMRSSTISQNSSENFLQSKQQDLTLADFTLQRGPRYKAYAELREQKLKMKHAPPPKPQQQRLLPSEVEYTTRTPPPTKRSTRSMVGQSVPDFSSVLRKENRKPALDMTPPPSNSKSRMDPKSELRGSKSAYGAEKRVGVGGGMAARKSYANLEELQGLSFGVATAINGEGRRGKNGLVGGYSRNVLGSRQQHGF